MTKPENKREKTKRCNSCHQIPLPLKTYLRLTQKAKITLITKDKIWGISHSSVANKENIWAVSYTHLTLPTN